jgi:hypothetical protein
MIIYNPHAKGYVYDGKGFCGRHNWPQTHLLDGLVPDDKIEMTEDNYVDGELDLCYSCIMDMNGGNFFACNKFIIQRGYRYTSHCPILLRDLVQKKTGILI